VNIKTDRYIYVDHLQYIMETANQYHQARVNGTVGEQAVTALLGCNVDTNALIDVLCGLESPIEIKTCAIWVRTEYTSSRRRRGRFILYPEQHRALINVNGYYVFCLLNEDREVFKIKVVPAREFYHPQLISGERKNVCVNWKYIFEDE